jgi:hypothetical protein
MWRGWPWKADIVGLASAHLWIDGQLLTTLQITFGDWRGSSVFASLFLHFVALVSM